MHLKKNPNPIEQKSLNQAAFGGETLARMKARFGLADPIEFTFFLETVDF